VICRHIIHSPRDINRKIARYQTTKKGGIWCIFAISLFLSIYSPRAFATEICPAKLNITGETASTPAGFGIWTNGQGYRRLTYVDFFFGMPQSQELILPDTQEGDQEIVNEWDFPSYNVSQGVWVGCHYFDTEVTLTRELPKNFKACRIDYLAPNRGHQRWNFANYRYTVLVKSVYFFKA
jgi:hypothetical protein